MSQSNEIGNQADRENNPASQPNGCGVSPFVRIILLVWLIGVMAVSFLLYSGTLLEKTGFGSQMMKCIEDGLAAFFS